MNYPIGTPFIIILNPMAPETSSYFGVVTSEPLKGLLPFDMVHYDIEYISSNKPGVDLEMNNRNLIIDEKDLEKAVKNYERYIGIRKD